MMKWDKSAYKKEIYNSQYIMVDPEFQTARPQSNSKFLIKILGRRLFSVRHLDYGGGNGVLSEILKSRGINSTSYDPFHGDSSEIIATQRFDLITAFEVFEHATDPHAVIDSIDHLIDTEGMILFSTQVSDGHIQNGQRLSWWYACPRNGHVCLFSTKSLNMLAETHGYKIRSISRSYHVMWKKMPAWATGYEKLLVINPATETPYELYLRKFRWLFKVLTSHPM